ncbi:MAG: TonB-dependent receptor plug domain-containing protein, partial [Bacteroidota bacterium]
QLKREEPIKVESIDVARIMEQSTSVPELINQTSGVKVRQASGVGSAVTVNINGLQGNAVRFFKDGIPTDYLGGAFQIGLVPTSIIKNVEIYKGVLPIELGADALGGAVNIVTKGRDQQFLDASYEIGSYNTHLINLNTNYIIPNTKVHVGVSSYYIHSDNDYEFDLDINDGGVTETFRVRRFHDANTAKFVEVNAGIHDAKFADLLDVKVTYFKNDAEVQNGIQINPNQAFGEVIRASESKIISLQYVKNILPHWNVDLFAALSQRDTKEQDLAEFLYDWFGITERAAPSGEVRLRDQRLDIDAKVGRFFTQYDLSNHLKIKASSTYNGYEQVGSDPYAEVNFVTGIQPITIPSKYIKIVSGFGIASSFLNDKLKGESFVKHYYLKTEAPSTFAESLTDKLTRKNFGWGHSFKYSLDDNSYARISYEDATRIPESEEYFGDFLFILANPILEPERSDNLNVGFATNLNVSNSIFLEINAFYRNTKDFIRPFPRALIFSINENSDTQVTKGIETNLRINLDKNSTIRAAITYQDLRRTDTQGTDIIQEDARTPNVPYFFTNLSINRQFNNPFNWPIKFNLYGNYLFTEKYLVLATPKVVEPKLFGDVLPAVESSVIDTQHQVNLGLTCNLKNLPISLNLEVINALNNELYDNFRIPKPPRNYRFKLTYRLLNN